MQIDVYHGQQLLNKVRKHLIKKNQAIVRSERRSPVDVSYIDNQIQDEVRDDFVELSADQELKLLNDTCLKEMLAYNKLEEKRKQNNELEIISSSQPRQRRLKKLQSTVLVSKLVNAKGINKKSSQQLDKEKLLEFLEKHHNLQRTEKNEKKQPKVNRLKLPDIPEVMSHRYQRATITTFRDYKQNTSDFDQQFQRQTSLTLISEPHIPLISTTRSKKVIGQLIDQINNERTSIIEQKKDIQTSLAKVKKNFDKLDLFGKLDRQEKFNYLKFEQRIFGRSGKHRKYF